MVQVKNWKKYIHWITESSKTFQAFCHFTQSHIELEISVPSSITEVCIWKLQKKKNTAPAKIYYKIKYIFCLDTFNENACS